MILPDINLLLYAYFSSFPEHETAKEWWEQISRGGESVGLAPPVVFGFIRLATNRRVFVEPMALETALAVVEEWLALPSVVVLRPGVQHANLALDLLRAAGVSRDLTTDVQIAAYALENKAIIHTGDADFSRFPGIRYLDPLGR